MNILNKQLVAADKGCSSNMWVRCGGIVALCCCRLMRFVEQLLGFLWSKCVTVNTLMYMQSHVEQNYT